LAGAQMLLKSSNGEDLTQKIATGRPYEEMQSGDFLLVVIFYLCLVYHRCALVHF
jgi:hypothetical protein